MIVYLSSRYSADSDEQFDEQIKLTKEFSRKIVVGGYELIAVHLYYPLFLDDDKESEREIGLNSAVKLVSVCDMLFVHSGAGISKGMRREINEAKRLNKKIYYFENNYKLQRLISYLQTMENGK